MLVFDGTSNYAVPGSTSTEIHGGPLTGTRRESESWHAT
jgi:hypothetical protein